MDSDKKSSIEYENRRGKAIAIIIASVIALLSFIVLRLTQDLETAVGIILATLIGGGLGVGWYFASNNAGIRHADVFGVVTQIIPKDVADGGPKTCFYVASAT
jgi:hypothetical protein